MEGAFPGLGTVINVGTIVVGSLLGMAAGHRLSERTRSVVNDCPGLTVLPTAGLSAAKVTRAPVHAPRRARAPGPNVLGPPRPRRAVSSKHRRAADGSRASVAVEVALSTGRAGSRSP